jgi:hypothetical protein
MDVCRQEDPAPRVVGERHYAACHLLAGSTVEARMPG